MDDRIAQIQKQNRWLLRCNVGLAIALMLVAVKGCGGSPPPKAAETKVAEPTPKESSSAIDDVDGDIRRRFVYANAFALIDESGMVRAELSFTTHDKKSDRFPLGTGPGLRIYDKNGVMRAGMWVDDLEKSHLEIRDNQAHTFMRVIVNDQPIRGWLSVDRLSVDEEFLDKTNWDK